MHQDSEPSVEEILASIKKVIARDNREGAAELRRSRSEKGVLPTRSDSEVLDLGQAGRCLDEGSDEGEPDAPLISDTISASMRESLDALAMISEPGARPQIVRSGETSLEGMVREMLRPMLAAWLEQNLSGMVEKLVAAEIARIAGKRG
jgi:cell pole-organizing protein PopZ